MAPKAEEDMRVSYHQSYQKRDLSLSLSFIFLSACHRVLFFKAKLLIGTPPSLESSIRSALIFDAKNSEKGGADPLGERIPRLR